MPENNRVARLTEQVYNDFEKKFRPPIVTATVTEIEAGYLLGVQAVLHALRVGYVV